MFKAILAVIRKIPRGKVASYGAVARAAGYAGAARQVVWALRSPAARGIAWHRVLGAGGKILLPRHAGLEQRLRLQSEGVAFRGERVDMKSCEWKFGRGSKPKAQSRKPKAQSSKPKAKTRREKA
jgi:methylated-DNA-protein-cysteine methyltransferase-like protein